MQITEGNTRAIGIIGGLICGLIVSALAPVVVPQNLATPLGAAAAGWCGLGLLCQRQRLQAIAASEADKADRVRQF